VTIHLYSSPGAFKSALEQRLKNDSNDGIAFARRRQLLVFDRFLARIVATFGDAATLKGGLVLELRLARARTTKDVDLRMMGTSDDLLGRLQAAARIDLGDYLEFEIGPDLDHPEIQNAGMQYDGMRFRAVCRLAAKPYGNPFGVDVAFGDPIYGEPDLVTAEDVLAFAGIQPPRLRLYPVETHIAEKLHAYTLPRERPNTRVKDLPDLALLASCSALEASRVRAALKQTFAFRKTHDLPVTLPATPSDWERPYAAMATEDRLRWLTLLDVTGAVRTFLEPVLADAAAVTTWDAAQWIWL